MSDKIFLQQLRQYYDVLVDQNYRFRMESAERCEHQLHIAEVAKVLRAHGLI